MELELIVHTEKQITEYYNQIQNVLESFNLPFDNILVKVEERRKVFKNIGDVLEQLESEQLNNANYLSKFIAAVSAGLFDAALNYLWNETITQLRYRVSQYDIQYFYDSAVSSQKRSKLSGVEDLIKIDDSELIRGCKEIGLISDIGYKMLDNIKYMRNWVSAAHPNHFELTGLQLIGWLETCIKQVICLPLTNITIETNKLLKNIKETKINKEEAQNIGNFFIKLDDARIETLANGFFGIYTRQESSQQARKNIQQLMPKLWERLSETNKHSFGAKYAQFSINGFNEQKDLARSFLEICEGLSYIPNELREGEILNTLGSLRSVHNSFNNFHNEYIFASQLNRLIGTKEVPKGCAREYINTLVYLYITNGHGIAWSAEPHYENMLNNLDQRLSMIAVASFREDDIASKLQFDLCKKQYKKMVNIVEKNITSPIFHEIIELIDKNNNLDTLRDDSKVKEKLLLVRDALK